MTVIISREVNNMLVYVCLSHRSLNPLILKVFEKPSPHENIQGGPKVTSQRFELIARPLIT